MRSDSGYRRLYEKNVELGDALADIDLSFAQRMQREAIFVMVTVVRPFYNFVQRLRGRSFDLTGGLEEFVGLDNTVRGVRRQETHGGHYLTENEVEQFQASGVVGPFRALSPDEAAEHRRYVYDLHAADWDGTTFIGTDTVEALKRHGGWSIIHGGMYQALAVGKIRQVAELPAVSERLASILGDEVVCWRSQLFEMAPGASGTFWHAATLFADDHDKPALDPPVGLSPGLVNINCWIALEDVGPENGCLRMVEGSFADARLDEMTYRVQKDRVGFAMSLGASDRRRAIMALRFSSDIFHGAQLVFDVALRACPNLLSDAEPVYYEMKAGEALIFSSNNVHGSFGNASDEPRLASGIRYATGDMGFYPDQTEIPYNNGGGVSWHSVEPLEPIPVHGPSGPIQHDR